MDLIRAFRSLRRRPAYALVVLCTIGLVVGPSIAMLAVADTSLVRPLPFPESDRLVRVNSLPPGLHGAPNLNPLGSLDFVRMREQSRLLEGLAGMWARERAIGGDGEPESVPVALVSANLFQVLGASPLMGRTFTDEEDHNGARLAVLGYGIWQRRFGANPRVIGAHVQIDREDYEVIGVMGPAFNPAFVTSELWTPLGIHGGNIILPLATFIQTVGRLRPGATAAQAQAELNEVMVRVSKESPAARGGWTAEVMSLRDAQFGRAKPAVLMLMVAIGSILLIACANLVNLTLAESAGRHPELALRAALGASRRDLIALQAAESLLLAVGGGAVGLVLASWILPAALSLDPTSAAALKTVSIDGRLQFAALVLATLVSLIAGIVPAMLASRGDVAGALAASGRRTAGAPSGRRLRSWLIASETALAVVLLASAALLLTGLARTTHTDPGFDPHNVLGAQLRLPAVAYPSLESRAQFIDQVLERVRATPGVASAGITHNLFIPGFYFITLLSIEGKPSPDGQPYTAQFRRVSPGYFATMRIRELRGRTFTSADVATSQPVAVISDSFARRYWPGEDAIGKRVKRGKDLLTVIGIVGDVSDVSLTQPPAPTIYVAYAQNNIATASAGLVVRTIGDPTSMTRAIAAAVHAVDPAQPLSNVTTVDAFLRDSVGPDRFRGLVLLAFAVLGLVLAALGIYGVTARGVTERTREVGVRLALGCSPAAVRGMILRQSLRSVIAGFACGIAGAVAANIALRHWLTGLNGAAPLAAVAAVSALAVAAVVAAGIPALSAGRVDPLAALRADS